MREIVLSYKTKGHFFCHAPRKIDDLTGKKDVKVITL